MSDAEVPPLPRPGGAPIRGSRDPSWPDWRRRVDPLIERARLWLAASAIAPGTVAFVVAAALGFVVWTQVSGTGAPPLETSLPLLDPVDVPVPSADPPAPSGQATAAGASMPPAGSVVVHVAGAVAAPGVRTLPEGSRIIDALDAAGGPTADADLDRINLAAPLPDGAQILVPRSGEADPGPVVGGDGGLTGSGPDASIGPVDVNTADADALESLPGVGPATAAAIIAHREEHGPFTSVTALDDVSGIGPARLEQLRELVTVGS